MDNLLVSLSDLQGRLIWLFRVHVITGTVGELVHHTFIFPCLEEIMIIIYLCILQVVWPVDCLSELLHVCLICRLLAAFLILSSLLCVDFINFLELQGFGVNVAGHVGIISCLMVV